MPQKDIGPGALARAHRAGELVAGQQQSPNSTTTSPTPSSWRDWVTVHPVADELPMMTDAELDELGESIMKTGELLVPLRLIPVCAFNDLRLPGRGAGGWTAAVLRAIKNKKLQLLDGRNRLEAIERWLRKHEGDPDENISIDYFFRDAEICHLDSDAEIEEQVVDLTGC